MNDYNIEPLENFSHGDMRKVWLILAVFLQKNPPTAITISDATGISRTTVIDILKKIMTGQIPGMAIRKEGSKYVMEQWGSFINRSEISRYYKAFKQEHDNGHTQA